MSHPRATYETKARAKPVHHESRLQRSCVKWFRMQHRALAKLLIAVPNGGKRSKIEAMIMSGEGVTPGMTDLLLLVPRGKYHGLCIEMKYGKGTCSAAQNEYHELLLQQGYAVAVCWTLDEFMKDVNEYLDS